MVEDIFEHIRERIDDETSAILLVGSRVDGTHREDSDIDFVIVRRNQDRPIINQKETFHSHELDLWFYDEEFITGLLERPASNYADLSLQSLVLSFLWSNSLVYRRDEMIDDILLTSKVWTWSEEVRTLLDYDSVPPQDKTLRKYYFENLDLLRIMRMRLDENKTVSHRSKDNKEHLIEQDDEGIHEVYNSVVAAYQSEGISREWTELADARKAIKKERWTLAVASLRDVLRFLVRIDCRLSEYDIVDPMMWTLAENSLSNDLVKTALKIMMKHYPHVLRTS